MARFILSLALLAATASAFVPATPTAQQRATSPADAKSPAAESSTALAYGYNSYGNGRGFLEYNDYFDRSTPNGEYTDPYSSYGRDKEQSSTYKPLFNQNRGYNNGYGRGYSSGRISDGGYGGYGYNALPSRSSYGGNRSSGRLSDMGKGYGYGPYSDGYRSGGYRSGGGRDAYGRAYDRGYNDNRGYGGYRTGRLSDEGKYYGGGRRSYDGYGGYRTGRLSDEGRYSRGGYNNGPYRSGYSSGYGYDSRPKGYGGITPTNDYRYSQSGTYKPLFGSGRSSYEEMAYSPNSYYNYGRME